jgi:hypothetical protein
MEDALPFGSPLYWIMLAVLLFARGMDFLSTWIATPRLVLEANPLARWMGWKIGLVVNVALCVFFSFWPFPTIVVATTSLLVAGRNFQSAWLMRLLGEEGYRDWLLDRMYEAPMPLYLLCLLGQTLLPGAIGLALVFFSVHTIPLAIGIGITVYAFVVLFYTLLSVWRIRRRLTT